MKEKQPTQRRGRQKSKAMAATAKRAPTYVMNLYVTGATPRSSTAITNLRQLCEEYLRGNYELRVIDLYQEPERAKEGMIIAAPTLVKSMPLPLRRFIGDLSNKEKLLRGLEIDYIATRERATGSTKD